LIIGGALTLFGNLDAVLKLADWARVLVENWHEWTQAFWGWVFGRLGVQVARLYVPTLSFLLFGSLLTIGQAVKSRVAIKAKTIENKYEAKAFRLISWRTILCLVVTIIFTDWWLKYVAYNLSLSILNILTFEFGVRRVWNVILLILIMTLPVAVLVIMFAKVRLYATVVVFLMVACWAIVTFSPLVPGRASDFAMVMGVAFIMAPVFSVIIPVSLLILLSVAPAKAISRRLIFLAIGVLYLSP
jgi:hypothetical protein